MIALVTDSNAMLTPELRARLRARVVPLTITIDGTEFTEDDELDTTAVFGKLRAGATVTTAFPSPGAFAAAYGDAASSGATEIVSVHIGRAFSGALDSAALAAKDSPIPVHLADSQTASFGVGLCVWHAAELIVAGKTGAEVAAAATRLGAETSSVFTVADLARASAGGRLQVDPAATGTAVFALVSGSITEVGRSLTIEDAVATMSDYVASLDRRLRVGVGHADNETAADLLSANLSALPSVAELVRYVSGASVAAHAGVGTFGAVWAPLAA